MTLLNTTCEDRFWKVSGGGSVMESPPPLIYHEDENCLIRTLCKAKMVVHKKVLTREVPLSKKRDFQKKQGRMYRLLSVARKPGCFAMDFSHLVYFFKARYSLAYFSHLVYFSPRIFVSFIVEIRRKHLWNYWLLIWYILANFRGKWLVFLVSKVIFPKACDEFQRNGS